jgi:hypothetical protein
MSGKFKVVLPKRCRRGSSWVEAPADAEHPMMVLGSRVATRRFETTSMGQLLAAARAHVVICLSRREMRFFKEDFKKTFQKTWLGRFFLKTRTKCEAAGGGTGCPFTVAPTWGRRGDMVESHYAVLGVDGRTASTEEIKRAYKSRVRRRLSLLWSFF